MYNVVDNQSLQLCICIPVHACKDLEIQRANNSSIVQRFVFKRRRDRREHDHKINHGS